MGSETLRHVDTWGVVVGRLRNMVHGWSVRELCERTGATRAQVNRVERGGAVLVTDLVWILPMVHEDTATALAWLVDAARRTSESVELPALPGHD